MGEMHPRELLVPSGALLDAEATEFVRAWAVNGEMHVTLAPYLKEPAYWGVFLVDLARHAARIYEDQGRYTEQQAMSQIRQLFDAEWKHATDIGTTGKARQ